MSSQRRHARRSVSDGTRRRPGIYPPGLHWARYSGCHPRPVNLQCTSPPSRPATLSSEIGILKGNLQSLWRRCHANIAAEGSGRGDEVAIRATVLDYVEDDLTASPWPSPRNVRHNNDDEPHRLLTFRRRNTALEQNGIERPRGHGSTMFKDGTSDGRWCCANDMMLVLFRRTSMD